QERIRQDLLYLREGDVAHELIVDGAVPHSVVKRRHFVVAELVTVDARGLLSGRRRLGEGRGRHGGCGERGAGQQRPAIDLHHGWPSLVKPRLSTPDLTATSGENSVTTLRAL